jgi:hypothetical protein
VFGDRLFVVEILHLCSETKVSPTFTRSEPAAKQMKQAKLTTPKEREKLDEPNRFYVVEDETPRPLRFVVGSRSAASLFSSPEPAPVPPTLMPPPPSTSSNSKDDIIDDFDDEFDVGAAQLHDSFNEEVLFSDDPTANVVDGTAESGDVLLLSGQGKIPRVEVPERINRLLHPYQREGVKFLYSLYVEKHGGILADDMGMGKTVQTISFVVAIKGGRAAEPGSFFKAKGGAVAAPFPALATKPILVICPASVLHNWHMEFHRWAKLRVFIAHAKVLSFALLSPRCCID